MISKVELKYQLKKMGIAIIEGNYVNKKYIGIILSEIEKEIQLEGNEQIRAKKNLAGRSNNWGMPEHIEISKGTVLKVPTMSTQYGDCFCKLIEGKCIVTRRSMLESSNDKKVIMKSGDTVGLSQGYKIAAHALGKIETDCWEIIK